MSKKPSVGAATGGQEDGGDKNDVVHHYKGVRMRKWGKWVAEVRLPNSRERIWLGSYLTAEEAARAYDAAVYCLRGPGARFNFPSSPPRIPSGGNLTTEQIREAAARYAHEWSHQENPSETNMEAAGEAANVGVAATAATLTGSSTGEGSGSYEDVLELLRQEPLECQFPVWVGRPQGDLPAEEAEYDVGWGGGDDKLWSYDMDGEPGTGGRCHGR